MTQIYGKIFSTHALSPTHLKILDIIGHNKKILELGASTGYLTKKFQQLGCQVDIVEQDKQDGLKAKRYARKLFIGNLEEANFLKSIKDQYDFIVVADVLEHLKNPDQVLAQLKKNLKNGKIIISLPNIACWQIRKDLFFRGKFEYQKWGIMDQTHLKFFTYYTIQKLLKAKGYKILKIHLMEMDYPLRLSLLRLSFLGKTLDQLIKKNILPKFPNLTAAHLIVEAQKNG